MILDHDELFKGINRHRIQEYLFLLSKNFDKHQEQYTLNQQLQGKVEELKNHAEELIDRKRLIELLGEIEHKLKKGLVDSKESDDFHYDKEIIHSLLKQIKRINSRLNKKGDFIQQKVKKDTVEEIKNDKTVKKKAKKTVKKKKGKKTKALDKIKPKNISLEDAERELDEIIISNQRKKIKKLEDKSPDFKEKEGNEDDEKLQAAINRINQLKEEDIL